MTTPNMATLTESLERSLQNCSLNHERRTHHDIGGGSGGGGPVAAGEVSDDNINNNNTSLELNSHLSLPYQWEQCLNLKTGEIYYINWMNGMKAREDPRTTPAEYSGEFYSDEDDEDDNDNDEDDDDDDASDDSLYDSEDTQFVSSRCSSGDCNKNNQHHRLEKDKDNVLVVAGCKSCLMYYMVPKQVEDCPKCNGQLLHFDRSETSSP